MTKNAEEIFMRFLQNYPWVYGDPAHPNGKERTDAELDALVAYAIRADAACRRENQRVAAANAEPGVIRPLPTSVPPAGRPVEISAVDRALNRLFGVR